MILFDNPHPLSIFNNPELSSSVTLYVFFVWQHFAAQMAKFPGTPFSSETANFSYSYSRAIRYESLSRM